MWEVRKDARTLQTFCSEKITFENGTFSWKTCFSEVNSFQQYWVYMMCKHKCEFHSWEFKILDAFEVPLLSNLMVRLSSIWQVGASSTWLQCPFHMTVLILDGILLSGVGIFSNLTSCLASAIFQEVLLSFSGKWCWRWWTWGWWRCLLLSWSLFVPLQWTD